MNDLAFAGGMVIDAANIDQQVLEFRLHMQPHVARGLMSREMADSAVGVFRHDLALRLAGIR